nr:hypothetical protein Iba_scaffold15946CG0420 [Ipomoea batatas]
MTEILLPEISFSQDKVTCFTQSHRRTGLLRLVAYNIDEDGLPHESYGATAWKGEQLESQQWKGDQLGSQQLRRENSLEANSVEGRTTWMPTAWKGREIGYVAFLLLKGDVKTLSSLLCESMYEALSSGF